VKTVKPHAHKRNGDPVQGPPPLATRSKDPIIMTIEALEQTDLDDKERTSIELASALWKRLGDGAQLDEWLTLIGPLQSGRRLAMRVAHTNQPQGRGYNEAFGAWRQLRFPGLGTTVVSCLLWLGDDPQRQIALAELRRAMTPDQRAKLNSPITARQKVEKMLKPKAEGDDDKPESATVKMKAVIVALSEENERLKRAADSGSLFDLQLTSGKGIGETIAKTITEWKWKEIVKAGNAVYAKRKQKPAG
jgi:hypothetical protein